MAHNPNFLIPKANLAAFPTIGSSNYLYLAIDTNLLYWYNGTSYILIGDTSVLIQDTPVNASGNPNYPATTKDHFFFISVAGKIGGASGIVVEAGDMVIANTTNAGGTQADVGANFNIIQTNLNPNLYALLSGATFTGPISTNGIVNTHDGTYEKVSLDTSPFRQFTWTTNTTGTLPQLFGGVILMYWYMHNVDIDASGNFTGAIDNWPCEVYAYDETGQQAFFTCPTTTAGQVPWVFAPWALQYYILSNGITAHTFTSDVATGTAPFTVSSTTQVANLNSESSWKATNLVWGNTTTLLGSIPYQSGVDTTTLLPPNTTVTKKYLMSQGDGTDGNDPTWDTIAAGITNFTESINTSAPNATTPVAALTATNAATNVDAAFIPKGLGAILAQIPDNTNDNGNKRGYLSVDLQRAPSGYGKQATQVASGFASALIGGRSNTASGDYSVSAWQLNIASWTHSIAVGNWNTTSGIASTAFGIGNIASGDYSTALGSSNGASGTVGMAAVMAGTSLEAQSLSQIALGQYNTIVSGSANTWVGTDVLIQVGNGADGAHRSDALKVLKNGNTTISGTLAASNLSGTNTGDQTNISGNAATATTASSLGTNGTATTPKITTGLKDTNGAAIIDFTATASAAREIVIANATSSNNPTIGASGGRLGLTVSDLEITGKQVFGNSDANNVFRLRRAWTDGNLFTPHFDITDWQFKSVSGGFEFGGSTSQFACDASGNFWTNGTITNAAGFDSSKVTTGTYTPTATNIANTDARTPTVFQYTRVGNNVQVWGAVSIDPTTTLTTTQINLTLPINSTLASYNLLSGMAGGTVTGVNQDGSCYADTSLNLCRVYIPLVVSTTAQNWIISFSYPII